MLRTFLLTALPFLLPFIAYGLFLLIARMMSRMPERRVHILVLATIGALLSVGSLLALRFSEGDSIANTYIPPHIENGRIVPAESRP